jgi:hypothetical protein
MSFRVVISSKTNQVKDQVFSFKTEHSVPNEEVWKIAFRNIESQLKLDEDTEVMMLKFIGCTTE